MGKYINPLFVKVIDEEKKIKKNSPVKKNVNKVRKKRNDSLKDVKIPISEEEKFSIQFQAIQEDISMTRLCSEVVRDNLYHGTTPNLSFRMYPSEVYEYVHIKLSQEDHKYVRVLAAKWQSSIREASRRILFAYL